MRSIAERLAAKTTPVPIAGCWLFTGALADGYGRIGNGPRSSALAHRVAWELVNGLIPAGLFVLHRCDVRCCVNPEHLFLGTQSDNMADMHAKGRHSAKRICGADHHSAKLNQSTVNDLRAQRRKGTTLAELARSFGVSISTVHAATTTATWRTA